MISPHHGDDPAGKEVSGDGTNNLILRVASAAVLAPLVLGITYAGGWLFLALCCIAASGILWEWTSLVAGSADWRILGPGLAALLAATVLAGCGLPEAAFAVIAIGATLAGLIVAGAPAGRISALPLWSAGGVVYAGALLLGPALLRRDPQWGFTALLFLFATVWFTDISAFFCGRAIGGPHLWPRVSPHKTWSGAIGGLIGGVAAGVAVAYTMGVRELGTVAIMTLLLSVLAQAGDLFESGVKRRFGVKDASHLIPGHGGLMDRLDGFLFAAFAALLIGILRQGTAAPARGLLVW